MLNSFFQSFWWLNDSMLMLATAGKDEKKKNLRYNMYIWTWGLWIVQEVRTIPALEQDDLKWNGIFERQNEIKTEPLNVDLKYQQSEPEFCEKPEAKVIKLLCVILPIVYVWGKRAGRVIVRGGYSLVFGEGNHQILKFLQKIFSKMRCKKIFRP